MKKSIILLALALVAFTNVTLASNSGLKANHYLTSVTSSDNGSALTLSKFIRVTPENAGSLSAEVESLKYTKSIDEVIAADIKVTESKVAVVKGASDIEQLKYTKTIEDVIKDNLKITESMF